MPGRQIVIVTRDPKLKVEGCAVCHSLAAAIELARANGETEVFICGGAEIYSQSIALADAWLVNDDFLLADLPDPFDIVIGNPPYVRQERLFPMSC